MARAIITVVLEDDNVRYSGDARERLVLCGPNLQEKAAMAVWTALDDLAEAYEIVLTSDEDEGDEDLPF